MTIADLRHKINNETGAPDSFEVKVKVGNKLYDIEHFGSVCYLSLPIGDDAFEVIELSDKNIIDI